MLNLALGVVAGVVLAVAVPKVAVAAKAAWAWLKSKV